MRQKGFLGFFQRGPHPEREERSPRCLPLSILPDESRQLEGKRPSSFPGDPFLQPFHGSLAPSGCRRSTATLPSSSPRRHRRVRLPVAPRHPRGGGRPGSAGVPPALSSGGPASCRKISASSNPHLRQEEDHDRYRNAADGAPVGAAAACRSLGTGKRDRQFSIYLRMADGKVPSIYGPSADEPWF
jgi:hypothetical protein